MKQIRKNTLSKKIGIQKQTASQIRRPASHMCVIFSICSFWIFLVLCVSTAIAIDSHTTALTLDQAISEALSNNPLIARSGAYRAAAEQEKSAAKAGFFPKIAAAYRYRHLDESPYVNMGGFETVINSTEQHHWEVTLTQPLFTGFAVSSRHRLAELGLETRTLEKKLVELQLAREVKQAYYTLLMVEKEEAVAATVLENLQAHTRDAERFYNQGIIPLNDLLKSRVAEAEAEQQKTKAEARNRNARAALNTLMGRPYSVDTAIVDIGDVERLDINLENFIAEAMDNRLDILEISRAIDAKDQEKRLAESDYYPRVELIGKYERDGDDLGARNNDYNNLYNASIGMQAQWNLFEGGKTRALSAKAGFEKNALESSRRQLQDEIRLQIQSACLALEVAEKNISTSQRALTQAKEHWRISDLRYRQQLATTTEVLDASTYLARAETGYYEALYGYGIARADLVFAMGNR